MDRQVLTNYFLNYIFVKEFWNFSSRELIKSYLKTSFKLKSTKDFHLYKTIKMIWNVCKIAAYDFSFFWETFLTFYKVNGML